MRNPRARHCLQSGTARAGDAAAQPNGVKSEPASGRINAATSYSHAHRDGSAMTTGRHGGHAPVSVELARTCGWSGTDDCKSDQQGECARSIANHVGLHSCIVLETSTLARPVESLYSADSAPVSKTGSRSLRRLRLWSNTLVCWSWEVTMLSLCPLREQH